MNRLKALGVIAFLAISLFAQAEQKEITGTLSGGNIEGSGGAINGAFKYQKTGSPYYVKGKFGKDHYIDEDASGKRTLFNGTEINQQNPLRSMWDNSGANFNGYSPDSFMANNLAANSGNRTLNNLGQLFDRPLKTAIQECRSSGQGSGDHVVRCTISPGLIPVDMEQIFPDSRVEYNTGTIDNTDVDNTTIYYCNKSVIPSPDNDHYLTGGGSGYGSEGGQTFYDTHVWESPRIKNDDVIYTQSWIDQQAFNCNATADAEGHFPSNAAPVEEYADSSLQMVCADGTPDQNTEACSLQQGAEAYTAIFNATKDYINDNNIIIDGVVAAIIDGIVGQIPSIPPPGEWPIKDWKDRPYLGPCPGALTMTECRHEDGTRMTNGEAYSAVFEAGYKYVQNHKPECLEGEDCLSAIIENNTDIVLPSCLESNTCKEVVADAIDDFELKDWADRPYFGPCKDGTNSCWTDDITTDHVTNGEMWPIIAEEVASIIKGNHPAAVDCLNASDCLRKMGRKWLDSDFEKGNEIGGEWADLSKGAAIKKAIPLWMNDDNRPWNDTPVKDYCADHGCEEAIRNALQSFEVTEIEYEDKYFEMEVGRNWDMHNGLVFDGSIAAGHRSQKSTETWLNTSTGRYDERDSKSTSENYAAFKGGAEYSFKGGHSVNSHISTDTQSVSVLDANYGFKLNDTASVFIGVSKTVDGDYDGVYEADDVWHDDGVQFNMGANFMF